MTSTQGVRRATVRAAEGDTSAQVMSRDNHSCVICGTRDRVTFHHILPRGAGGSASAIPPHLAVALCGSGTTGCHGQVERRGREQGWAYRLGYLARHGRDDLVTDDGTHLVWGHAHRVWWELWPSAVRTSRPDLPSPDPGDVADFG